MLVHGEVGGGAVCDGEGGADAGHAAGGDAALWKTPARHPIRLEDAQLWVPDWLGTSKPLLIAHSRHTLRLGGRRDASEPDEDSGR